MKIVSMSKDISFTYDFENEKWYIGSSVAKVVGYEKTRNAILRHVDAQNKKSVFVDSFIINNEYQKVNSTYVFINQAGAIQLVTRSKLLTAEIKSLILIEFGIPSIVLPADTRELQFFELVDKFMKYKVIRQYRVDNYILDGYIQELNIAIEYDESYHKCRKNYILDKLREDYVKNKLKCRFIRLSDAYSSKENVEFLLSYIDSIDINKSETDDRSSYIQRLLSNIIALKDRNEYLTDENYRLKKIAKYFLDRDKEQFVKQNGLIVPMDSSKFKKFLSDITTRLVNSSPIYTSVRIPDYYEREEDFYA